MPFDYCNTCISCQFLFYDKVDSLLVHITISFFFLWIVISDQLPVSTKYDLRSDPGVEKNYGKLLLEMVSVVPDGIVCFFVSYSYMDGIVNSWHETGLLKVILASDLSQNFQRELYLYLFFPCNLPSVLFFPLYPFFSCSFILKCVLIVIYWRMVPFFLTYRK